MNSAIASQHPTSHPSSKPTSGTAANPNHRANANDNTNAHAHASAVVLLSGGLDSVTCLYWAKANFRNVTAVSFNYGQRHNSELQFAIKNAQKAGVAHRIIDIDIAQLGGSSLTDHALAVPTGDVHKFDTTQVNNDAIPNTYVPARNTIFLSYALAVAEVTNATHIVIGVSSVDYSGYPDCRPDYIHSFETMANLATKAGVMGQRLHIDTPLQTLSKAETIALGLSLGVDYADTVSCYQADVTGLACGRCDSCALRKQGFEQAGVADPTRYLTTD